MGEVVCLSSYRERKLREENAELAEYIDWILEGFDMTPQPYYLNNNGAPIVSKRHMALEAC